MSVSRLQPRDEPPNGEQITAPNSANILAIANLRPPTIERPTIMQSRQYPDNQLYASIVV